VKLLDLVQDAPAICGDARLPEMLLQAGLAKPECAAVLALTNDDQANLAVAMSVRLLNPDTPVLARAMSAEVAANMASFGTDHIVNPFARFGTYLGLALAAPASYRLTAWLTGLPGSEFNLHLAPPRGHWVVCGYGRFGREVVAALRRQGLDASVIDPADHPVPGLRTIKGIGTEAEPLIAAGIRESVGVVAGTDDDITNLSIAVTAREINTDLFTVVRQNLQGNSRLFAAFDADITMVSSGIVANDCLAVIKTPRLATFLGYVREQSDGWASAALERAVAAVGESVPEIWNVQVTPRAAPALHRALSDDGRAATIGDLARDPRDRQQRLSMTVLGLWRGGQLIALPDDAAEVRLGDELLYAGTLAARRAQVGLLRNLNVCTYLLTGNERPSGWVWQRLAAGRSIRPSRP
jgi:voltage-gated potassium channel